MSTAKLVTLPVAEPASEARTAVRSEFLLSSDIVMLSEPADPRAEAIRVARTHLVNQHLERGRRALAVCAPNSGAGGTFIAANLAVAFAQIGVSTMLIDADVNSGGERFPIRPLGSPVGLTDVLRDDTLSAATAIHATLVPNLSFIPAGRKQQRSEELLGRDRFRQLLQGCMRDYDLTIIDTPPANQYSDVRRVACVAGYALIVARKDHTLVTDIKTLTDELTVDQVKVIGAVLNED
jgi:Mrp family chromosome partitioning ATPase